MASLPLRQSDIDDLLAEGYTPQEILFDISQPYAETPPGVYGPELPPAGYMTPGQRARMSEAVGFGGMVDAASMEPVYRTLGGLSGLLSAPAAQRTAREMYADAEHQRWLQEQRWAGLDSGQQIAERVAGAAASLPPRAASLIGGVPGLVAQQAGEWGATPEGVTDVQRAAIGGAIGLAAGPAARGLGALAEVSPLFPIAMSSAAGSAAYRLTPGTHEEKAAAAIEAAAMTGAISLAGVRRAPGGGPRTIDATFSRGAQDRLIADETGSVRFRSPARENRIKEMIELRDEGLSFDEIGARLGVSGASVRLALQREGVHTPGARGSREEYFGSNAAGQEHFDEKLSKMLALRRAGWNNRQIGDAFRMTREGVRKFINEHKQKIIDDEAGSVYYSWQERFKRRTATEEGGTLDKTIAETQARRAKRGPDAELLDEMLSAPVSNPRGLRGAEPAPDIVPRSKRGGKIIPTRVPEIRTFETDPKDVPSLIGVPPSAGTNLGSEFQAYARLDSPSAKYASQGQRIGRNKDSGWIEVRRASDGKKFKIGEAPTPEARLERIVELFNGDEQFMAQSADWYDELARVAPSLLKGHDVPESDRYVAGLVGNKNTSPLGALAQAASALEARYGSEIPIIGGLGTADIAKAIQGGSQDIWYGPLTFKLPDFIDAATPGKRTRSSMNNDPRAGAPVPIDIHAMRASGGIDAKLANRLMPVLDDASRAALKKLKKDGDAPTPLQYARSAEGYRGFAKHLDDVKFLGRIDWAENPKRAQALEWIAFTRGVNDFSGRNVAGGEMPSDIQSYMQSSASLEVSLPDAVTSVSPQAFATQNDFNSLADDLKHDVTYEASRVAARIAESIVGVPRGTVEIDRVAPTFWEVAGNPAAVMRITALPDTRDALFEVLTAIQRQSANISLRPNRKGDTLGFVLKSPDFADSNKAKQAYMDIRDDLKANGILIPGGFTPTSVGGVPAIASLYVSKAAQVIQPKAGKDAKGQPRPVWVTGKKTVKWIETNKDTGRSYVEEAADEIRQQMTNPEFAAKVSDSIGRVAGRMQIELEGSFNSFDSRVYDNPDPVTGEDSEGWEGPLSRLRRARRPNAAGVAARSIGGAYDQAIDQLVRAARDRQRARIYGAAGDVETIARLSSPVTPALLHFRRGEDGSVVNTHAIDVRPGQPHQAALRPEAQALATQERIGLPQAMQKIFQRVDPPKSQQAWVRSWYKTGFKDRRTGELIAREDAMKVLLDEVGVDAEALMLGMDKPVSDDASVRMLQRRRKEALVDGLDSSLLVPMVKDAVIWWQHPRVQARTKRTWEDLLARLRMDFPD